MSITPDWLQYGAFGLLAILMFIFAWYVRDKDKFMQGLISKAEAKDEARLKDWQDMTRRAVESLTQSANALDGVCARLDNCDARQDAHNSTESDRHQEIMDALRSHDRGVT